MQRPGPQLPSIRQLHPYLPPPPVTATSEYAGSPETEHDGDREHDPERDDEPPKKKRRRQALSCTGGFPPLLP
ncbi:hypothetical protein B0H17DRAFT_1082221 [Mycena rosella]|uniref:Uncharacterized protein n=1 Tax=Mycena rosella TaxID=1033263 RepID=A0AAD7GBP6_MYCRO|nr:hypothetical protein B0H17DRAFT_1082221 [Mycena rosella]